jgi:hypothetical protein
VIASTFSAFSFCSFLAAFHQRCSNTTD